MTDVYERKEIEELPQIPKRDYDSDRMDYMSLPLCPECGEVGINEGHCFTCMSCGYSLCAI